MSTKYDEDLDCARDVIAKELTGLNALLKSLGNDFKKAIDILAGTNKHVIITGMGKPGHIGRKIAATLSSTGTPAFFVHPSEASHGDLGMLISGSCIMALSWSGETYELYDILKHSKRFGLHVIGITGNSSSMLAEASDVVLELPTVQEACPYGLAPTTSTNMMLAIGDAIAVCLLKRKKFQSDDFKIFHPGGKIGKRLLKVSDIMNAGDSVPIVTVGCKMSEAIIIMTKKSFGCVGVLDGKENLVGVITDGDLRRHMSESMISMSVEDVMTKDPCSVSGEMAALEALQVMNCNGITSVFVVEGKKPIGILHIHGCLRAGIV